MRNEFWRHNNSETGQTEQSESRNEPHVQNRNLTAQNEKNLACDFFSHAGNFDAISCKKMREYREIAPENDPWNTHNICFCQVIRNYQYFLAEKKKAPHLELCVFMQ